MKLLRVPPINEVTSVWTIFMLGFSMCCFMLLLAIIATQVITAGEDKEMPRWVGVRLFRPYCLLFAYMFILSADMYIWQKNGVNHILIFEINPRDHLTWQELMLIASGFLSAWSLFVLAFLFADELHTPNTVWPLAFFALCLIWLFQPMRCCARSARIWFVKHVIFCFMAPFRGVHFADFWIADQMITLMPVFLDFQYTVCFYTQNVNYTSWSIIIRLPDANTTGIDAETGADICTSNVYWIRPIVSSIPAAIRFLQCLRRCYDKRQAHPHLTNAGKYSSIFFILIFGALNKSFEKKAGDNAFFYFWILAYAVSFMYTISWDFIMDWGLLNRKSKNKCLRDELIYGWRGYYYFGMITNFLLRFAWVLNVSLGVQWLNSDEHDLWIMVTTPFECFRRFVWNLFRLENEHVNNCGGFRETVDISIKPIPQEIEKEKDKESLSEKVEIPRKSDSKTPASVIGKRVTFIDRIDSLSSKHESQKSLKKNLGNVPKTPPSVSAPNSNPSSDQKTTASKEV